MNEEQTQNTEKLVNGPAVIVRAIEEAEIVRHDDPDDLTQDGEVIGKAEPMSDHERMAALHAASEEWVRMGDTMIVPPTDEGRDYMKLLAVDGLNAYVRTAMFDVSIPIAGGWSAEAKDELGKRIMRVRVENLADWLRESGWAKVASEQAQIAESLEQCYAGQPAEVVAIITNDVEGAGAESTTKKVAITINQHVVRLAGAKASPTIHKHVAQALELSKGKASEYVQALKIVFEAGAWELLLRTSAEASDVGTWLRIIVRPYVDEIAKEVLGDHERKERAKPISRVRTTAVRNREFLRLPKIAAGVSWAFGGSGVTMESVRIDGRDYTPAPDIAIAPNTESRAIVPAGITLLPAEYVSKPHQAVLPLDETGQESAPPLAVAIAGATQYAITLPAAKLAILIMGKSMNRRFDPTTASLRELAQRINPGARLVKSHFETITKSLAQLDNLRVMLPNGLSYRVLDTPVPWRELTPEEYDQPLVLGFARSFAEAVMQNVELTAGRSYRGEFLLDETGVMELKHSGVVRQYVRSAAFWNAYFKGGKGEPDPAKVPATPTEQWAALTNHLSPAAAEYAHTKNRKRGGHVRMAEAVKEILEGVQELEAKGLVRVDKADKKQIRLLPPEIYLEAWQKSRSGEDRKGG
jgi:hypothetical protein